MFYPGFDINVDSKRMEFEYKNNVFGPDVEKRYLKDIRKSLKDPEAEGPEILYTIAMDVGKESDKQDLKKRNLLYGAVMYSKGQIGKEPVRSQGHIHAVSKSCNSSTPEVYEIWQGEAVIYMQESGKKNPGRCFAVYAKEGEVVIVPPGWAHCTINANINENMVFGAWCVRDYGFEYIDIRENGGVAFFPEITKNGKLQWSHNEKYEKCSITVKEARCYDEFDLKKGVAIYSQYEQNNNLFQFVTNPEIAKNIWLDFIP